MKIDRVILALNNNQLYIPFFNMVAPIWRDIFNIKPTLVFNGTKEEFDNNNFEKHGVDFIILNKESSMQEGTANLREGSWAITWSLFWGAAQFKNDVCMLSGIDQIPLGNFFIDKIKNIPEDKFIISFSDAYSKINKDTLGYFNTNTNIMYPSSHLIGKGSMFEKIFNINLDWKTEVEKVYSCKNKYYFSNSFNTSWGLDECYASDMLCQHLNKDEIVYLNIFWDYWMKNRLFLSQNSCIDFSKIQIQNYSELVLNDKSELFACMGTIKNLISLLKVSYAN